MKIYIVRHGETDWNVAYKCQGFSDIELNENGINQAMLVGKRFGEINKNGSIKRIYASDLKRAYETARQIHENVGVEIIKDQRLREVYFGILEGRLREENEEHFKSWGSLNDYKEHEGESFNDIVERMGNFFDEIMADETISANDDIVIVSHGGSIWALLCHIFKFPRSERLNYQTGNTSVYCIEKQINGNYEILQINDLSHLGEN